MFEPEYLDITCPGCHQREVYVDREMGFYCIFCGRQFSVGKIQLIMDAEMLRTSEPSVSPGGWQTADHGSQHRRTIWTCLGHALSRFFLIIRHQH